MKCPSCGTSWPANVKFCGKCGSRLDASAGLKSPAAAEVNSRLKEYLPQLGIAQFKEARPGIHIGQKGSTYVEVRVVPVGPRIAVRSSSPVTIGTRITQELLHFLLTENANMLFGAFGVGPRNEIVYTHTIMATSMDLHELGASVSAVVNTADKYDDQIVQRWGGKTARQSSMDQILAPALLRALLKAKVSKVQVTSIPKRPLRRAQHAPSPTIRMPGIPDMSNAIKVTSVAQEYACLAKQRCHCGGRYNRNTQALLDVGGKKYDQLSISCAECGEEKQLLFDINSFFGKS